MAHPSDARVLVLHAVRVKGLASDDHVAEVSLLPVVEARRLLESFAEQGWATYRDGRLTGWTLTAEGRAQHAKLVGDELDASGARDAVHAAYRDFLTVNAGLLGVCTEWQLKPGANGGQELNDHS